MADASGNQTTMLVIVDPQNDFHEGGSLPVTGATKDSERLANWISSQGSKITDITVTLDTHKSYHIGHGAYWTNDAGKSPDPFTLIKRENLKINGGEWQAKKEGDRQWANEYVGKLEDSGKFVVCIWPEHCIKGTNGHNVFPTVADALTNWEQQTKKKVTYLEKGEHPHTEMYSALRAEIPIEDVPPTQLNTSEIARWDQYSRVVFCGEAKSHCVNFTCTDFQQNAKKAQVIVLKDCQSSVAGFEDQGNGFFKNMENANNASLVDSTSYKL